MKPRSARRVTSSARELGAHVRSWRGLLRLRASELADRAGISVPTLRRIEQGQAGVSFDAVARVLLILGRLEAVVEATDPYATDLGRARADEVLPERVRRPREPT